MDKSSSTAGKRFKINPVEILIFTAVTALFAKSVYNLAYSPQAIGPADMQQAVTANPLSEGRAPASVSQAFGHLDFRCEAPSEQNTASSKVRLSGAICGMSAGSDTTLLSKSTVTNQANKFVATVFTDLNAARFSTDYIPLNLGKNPIRVEFSFRDGRVIGQDLVLTKE